MGVVRNTFNTTISSFDYIEHTIYDLTPSVNKTIYISTEASLYYLRSIYQTLIDAGYGDVEKNESEYSITLFGFKFYALARFLPNSGRKNFYAEIYIHGTSSEMINAYNSYVRLNNVNNSLTLSHEISVIGDGKTCAEIGLYCNFGGNSAKCRLLLLAKAKNLISGENAFAIGRDDKFIYVNKNDLCTIYEDDSQSGSVKGCSSNVTPMTINKISVVPVIGFNHCFLTYGIIFNPFSDDSFASGSYYKIGNDIYYVSKQLDYDYSILVKAS